MARKGTVNGLDVSPKNIEKRLCERCATRKMARVPIPKPSTSRSENLIELVHTDISEFPTRSKGGSKYFVTFIDDKSRFSTVYTMKSNSECFTYFQRFKKKVETEIGKKIRKMRSDGGGEYLSTEFTNFFSEHGIHHQQSCAYTPQQNGVAERMNRTLKDLGRAMIHHKGIDFEFWADDLVTVAYIRNRVTSRGIPPNTNPYELWHGRKPDLSNFRVFGSSCWYKTRVRR